MLCYFDWFIMNYDHFTQFDIKPTFLSDWDSVSTIDGVFVSFQSINKKRRNEMGANQTKKKKLCQKRQQTATTRTTTTTTSTTLAKIDEFRSFSML